jgi:hypothetical protein
MDPLILGVAANETIPESVNSHWQQLDTDPSIRFSVRLTPSLPWATSALQ